MFCGTSEPVTILVKNIPILQAVGTEARGGAACFFNSGEKPWPFVLARYDPCLRWRREGGHRHDIGAVNFVRESCYGLRVIFRIQPVMCDDCRRQRPIRKDTRPIIVPKHQLILSDKQRLGRGSFDIRDYNDLFIASAFYVVTKPYCVRTIV